MAVSERQLFLDLEALSEDQIEVALTSGVWGDPARPIVQRYLDQMKLRRIEAAASAQLDEAREALIAVRELWTRPEGQTSARPPLSLLRVEP